MVSVEFFCDYDSLQFALVKKNTSRETRKTRSLKTNKLLVLLGNFRFDYEHEIEYGNVRNFNQSSLQALHHVTYQSYSLLVNN